MSFDLNTLLSAELHDLKNQLQSVLSMEDDLLASGAEGAIQEKLIRLKNQSNLLKDKTIELLSVMKMKQEDFRASIFENYLSDTLDGLLPELQAQYPGCQIKHSVDSDINAYYDEQLLCLALRNAIVNAAQAGASAVDISASEQNGGLIICVADNGPGFPADLTGKTIAHLSGTGHGMGLYLIDKVMALHTRGTNIGHIELVNPAEGGGCIQLYLP